MFWEAVFSCFFVRGRHIAASDERGAALVVRRLMAAYVRADAKRRCSASWDRESRAVAALRPAGYSSGRGDCARGGCSAGRCGSLGMSCTRSRLPLRFSRGVLCSIRPAVCRVSAKQDGLRYVAFLFRRGSGSPVARSRIAGAVIRLGWFTLGLRVFCGDPDGSTRGRGGRRRRGVGALLRDHIGFAAFSAGSPLGRNVEAALRPRPRLRQRVFDSLDSLHLGCNVGALHAGKALRV